MLAIGLAAGCATASDSYSLTVKTDLNGTPAAKKYALVYTDQLSADLIEPLGGRLGNALAQRGYEPVKSEDATVIIYIRAVKDHPSVVTRKMTPQEAGVVLNPDSVRHKNVAAIESRRYPEMLDNSPDRAGAVFLGPGGEVVSTGDLRRETGSVQLPEKKVVVSISALVVCAVDAPVPQDPAQATIRWRVEVRGEMLPGQPGPGMERLVEIAADNLEAKTRGPVPVRTESR